MTDDLVAWLGEQIDAAETRTRELLYWAQQTALTLKDPKLLGKHIPGWHDWPKVERMCHERLAELDAARRMLEPHRPVVDSSWPAPGHCLSCWDVESEDYMPWPCPPVRLLAAPYAGQPGYRKEWRPQ